MSERPEKRNSKFSPAMAKILKRIDLNTRAVAKVCSAEDYLLDLDEQHLPDELYQVRFRLMQERRNLKTEFEREWKRLQTSA